MREKGVSPFLSLHLTKRLEFKTVEVDCQWGGVTKLHRGCRQRIHGGRFAQRPLRAILILAAIVGRIARDDAALNTSLGCALLFFGDLPIVLAHVWRVLRRVRRVTDGHTHTDLSTS
jgi:hypothetical protein